MIDNELPTDYDVRLATLKAMGGSASPKPQTIYEVDLKILEKAQEGSGIPEAPEDGKTYGRKDGDWSEIETDVNTDEIEDVTATAFADLNTKVDDNNTAINTKVDLNAVVSKNDADAVGLKAQRELHIELQKSDELSAAGIYYSVKSSDDTIKDIIKLTQAEYDAITTPDTKTLYIITD